MPNFMNPIYKIYFENKILNNLPVQKQKEKLANVKYTCKGFWNVVTNYNIYKSIIWNRCTL